MLLKKSFFNYVADKNKTRANKKADKNDRLKNYVK